MRACVSACVRACVRGLLRAAAAQIQGAGQWRDLASGKNPVREKNPLETACDLHSKRRENAKKPSPRKRPSLGFFLKSLLNHREILGFFLEFFSHSKLQEKHAICRSGCLLLAIY